MDQYYQLKKKFADEVIAMHKAFDKQVADAKKQIKALGFDVKSLVYLRGQHRTNIVGFVVNDASVVDKKDFIKRELPALIPKRGTKLSKLIQSFATCDAGTYISGLVKCSFSMEATGDGLFIRRMSYGVYGDKAIVAIPGGCKFDSTNLKRISDRQFEKIQND